MGAGFAGREGGRLPLAVIGTDKTVPITYRLPVPSAQVKSAVLLAGLKSHSAPGQPLPVYGQIAGFTPEKGEILKADLASQGLKGVYFRQLLFDGRRREQTRLMAGVDDGQRVAVEGDHGRGKAALTGGAHGHADHELVAGVHAVEGAQSDTARPPRRGGEVGHDLHQSITRGRSPGPSSSGP